MAPDVDALVRAFRARKAEARVVVFGSFLDRGEKLLNAIVGRLQHEGFGNAIHLAMGGSLSPDEDEVRAKLAARGQPAGMRAVQHAVAELRSQHYAVAAEIAVFVFLASAEAPEVNQSALIEFAVRKEHNRLLRENAGDGFVRSQTIILAEEGFRTRSLLGGSQIHLPRTETTWKTEIEAEEVAANLCEAAVIEGGWYRPGGQF